MKKGVGFDHRNGLGLVGPDQLRWLVHGRLEPARNDMKTNLIVWEASYTEF
jgi:hypothetical protein